MNTKPVVDWQLPETLPNVPKGGEQELWLAVESKGRDGWRKFIFAAQYVNKPLEYTDDDTENEEEPIYDYLVNCDGEPIEAIGWYSLKSHAEFDDYYEPIEFGETCRLLGWGEYIKPDFIEKK